MFKENKLSVQYIIEKYERTNSIAASNARVWFEINS